MDSEYIPSKSKVPTQTKWEWQSLPYNAREDKKQKEEGIQHENKKKQLHNINIEDLTFRDVYHFPFKTTDHSWVYDYDNNFIFQFEKIGKDTRDKVISILNGEQEAKNRQKMRNEDGLIQIYLDNEWHDFILIRGWGNLTGTGGYNLPSEKAVKIQDTLAEYIMEKLAEK